MRIPELFTACKEVEGEDGMYEDTDRNDDDDDGYGLPLRHYFRFLSQSLARRVAKKISKPADFKAAKQYSLRCQLMEIIVQESILARGNSEYEYNQPAIFKFVNWKMGHVGLLEKASSRGGDDKSLIKDAPGRDSQDTFAQARTDMLSTLSSCRVIEYFSSQVLTCKVTDLQENTLYKSKVVNALPLDGLVVSHDQKMVYLNNLNKVTDQKPEQHSIKPSTLMDVLTGLNMMS